MIKSALEYIVGLRKRDATIEIEGERYILDSDGTVRDSLHAWKESEARALEKANLPAPACFSTTTLASIAQYTKDDPERFFVARAARPVIHVESPTTVVLYVQLDKFGRRIPLIKANAVTPSIRFGDPMSIEQFIISLQSCFAPSEDRDALLSMVSKITDEASRTIKDNGMAQTVEVRQGVATIGESKVPNPVVLAPFRTFIEVEQPQSYYVFRVHEGPRVALYSAGGAEWEIGAIDSIRDYFKEELKGASNAYIIA